jgi:hypothetical protein
MQKLTKSEKDARKKNKQDKIYYECYAAWKEAKLLNPEKYLENKPALNRTQAIYWKGYSTYWAKCKYGHVAERTVAKSSCPICDKISKSIRSAKMRGGNVIALTAVEKNQIFEIYNEAKKLSLITNIPHHVDHIRPLAAGGTHHPENLRVIPASENLSKGSHYNGSRKSYSAREKKILREKFVQEQNSKKELLKEQKRRIMLDAKNKNNILILLAIASFAVFLFIIS